MKTHTFSPAGWHSHRSTRQIWKSQTEKGITVQEADKNFTISDYSSVSALQQAPNSWLFVFKHWVLLYVKGILVFLEPQHCHCLTLHSQIQSFYGFYEPSCMNLLWTFFYEPYTLPQLFTVPSLHKQRPKIPCHVLILYLFYISKWVPRARFSLSIHCQNSSQWRCDHCVQETPLVVVVL